MQAFLSVLQTRHPGHRVTTAPAVPAAVAVITVAGSHDDGTATPLVPRVAAVDVTVARAGGTTAPGRAGAIPAAVTADAATALEGSAAIPVVVLAAAAAAVAR